MNEPTTIRSERLLLRPFSFNDVEDVLAYASDPGFSRFLPLPNQYTIRDAEEFVARTMLQNWDTHPSFAIEFNGNVAGAVELSVDAKQSIASLHYAIARTYWNQGLMSEAANAVINWGFQNFDLAKVYSWADVGNVGSWRVMEKIGMTLEGTFRSHGTNRGVRQDYHYYGILRREWECSGPIL